MLEYIMRNVTGKERVQVSKGSILLYIATS